MFPHTMRLGHRPKSVDVDDFIAKRERRRALKKKVASVFKPFHFHLHHHHDHGTHESHDYAHAKDDHDATPPELLQLSDPTIMSHDSHHEVATSSSGSSTGISDVDSDEEMEVDVDSQLPVTEECKPEAKVDVAACKETVTTILSLSVMYAIGSQPMPSPEEEYIDVPLIDAKVLPLELQNEIANHYNQRHEPAAMQHPLSEELTAEITAYGPPEPTPLWRPLTREAIAEIADRYNERPEPATLQRPLPPKLSLEIVSFSWPAPAAEQTQEASTCDALVLANSSSSDEDLTALKTKCANLSTITELLSKQLVESTLTKKREHITQRKESKLYRDMIRQLEAKHRAEMTSWQSDKRYLEEKLRFNTKESIPPSIRSASPPPKSVRFEEDEKAKKANTLHRRSFMDAFVTPMELCTSSPVKGQPSRASFSMASTMIMQNRFLPAMLSAVAQAQDLKKP
ncbi:expressed unknown protein [Seminavis robusta]|uniref:Uncharacterized protein n=1 Tax=Seminavis robusta TaxID=568900 RepID=A0A9N8HEY5_9STRA|nr:expressed unknown protein [Seminavis robusta]|eukprot:Sro432_g141660.1 n/a (456) ;mRNA; r:36321-37688